jgi:hypothetical protein
MRHTANSSGSSTSSMMLPTMDSLVDVDRRIPPIRRLMMLRDHRKKCGMPSSLHRLSTTTLESHAATTRTLCACRVLADTQRNMTGYKASRVLIPIPTIPVPHTYALRTPCPKHP